MAQALGITIVPLIINFGDRSYIDGIDLDADQFYYMLQKSDSLPTTSQPSPADFTSVYQNLVPGAEGIVSIHISEKLSGTYNSALLGREAVETSCRIEVIDSLQGSMGVGLIAMQAARAAQSGADLEQVLRVTGEAISKTHVFGTVDTLEYLHKGGRIGKAQVLLGTMLRIKPMLHIAEGEVHSLGMERTRKKALNRLFEIVKGYNIKDIAVLHSTTPDEAAEFTQRITSILGREKIIQARIGPVIGTYLGPGALIIGIVDQSLSVEN